MKLKYLLILLLLIFSKEIFAQNISGKVFEPGNNSVQPIGGANVYWSNTSIGTATNKQGEFNIPQTNKTNLLIISFIGYKSDTIITTAGKQYYEVTLHQNKELEEVVIAKRAPGAHISRTEPILTTKITSEELCKAACCNLAESFETNPSVDVGYSDAVTGAKQIQLLGLNGNYVQLMTENYPNFYGLGQSFGLSYIPGTWMESIQISKGNSSVKNGYEALTGQINVEYKKPKTSERLFVNLFASDAGKTEANMNSSVFLNNKLSTMIFAHAENLQKENDHNHDGFLDSPKNKQVNFMNRWDYFGRQITIRSGVKFLAENRNGGQVSNVENMNNSDRFRTDFQTQRLEGFLKTGYSFKDKNSSSIGWINAFTHHKQESVLGENIYNASQQSIYSNLILDSGFGSERHKYSAGISFKYDKFDEDLNATSEKRTEIVPGTFFEYTFSLPNKLVLLAGIRSDFHNEYGTFITPRLHAKYDINNKYQLRASAGKGYRSPQVLAENANLLASAKSFEITEDIKQEEAWNFGLNLTRFFLVGGKELSLSGEFYRTQFINQLIVDMESDARKIMFYNLDGESFSNNYQVETSYELLKGLETTVAFRYTDVQTTINHELKRKPLISEYKGLFTTSYATPLNKWQLDFTVQFNGGGRMPSTEGYPDEFKQNERFSPYTIINSQITKRFRLWELYVGVENATDFTQKHPIVAADNPNSEYFDATKIWGPLHGRKLYIGMRLSIERE